MSSPQYKCSVCNRGVIVTPDAEIVRACEHRDAAVTADISATVYGVSSMMQQVEEEAKNAGV